MVTSVQFFILLQIIKIHLLSVQVLNFQNQFLVSSEFISIPSPEKNSGVIRCVSQRASKLLNKISNCLVTGKTTDIFVNFEKENYSQTYKKDYIYILPMLHRMFHRSGLPQWFSRWRIQMNCFNNKNQTDATINAYIGLLFCSKYIHNMQLHTAG